MQIDLTINDREESGFLDLAGLRPLVDMPELGYTRDPQSPVNAGTDTRELFCEDHDFLERCIRSFCKRDAARECDINLPAPPPDFFGPNLPPDCTKSRDLSVGSEGVTLPGVDQWLPFSIELPREGNYCTDQTGQVNALAARQELRETIEQAVLRQLWYGEFEYRGLNLAKIARDESAVDDPDNPTTNVASSPISAWSTIVHNMERDLRNDYTMLWPRFAQGIMHRKGLIRDVNGVWRDVNNRRTQAGGVGAFYDHENGGALTAGWRPLNGRNDIDADGRPKGTGMKALPTDIGSGYIVGTGPVWFAISNIQHPLTTVEGLPVDGNVQVNNHIHPVPKANPYVTAIVFTRSCDTYAVLTNFNDRDS